MKTETYTCDLHNCKHEAPHKGEAIQVIFTTEQTEGRGITPYLSMETLDICDQCMAILMAGNYIWASGAQGHNEYNFQFKNK